MDVPAHLLRRFRRLRSNRTLTWLACVPIALLGLGLFNLSAHAAQLPELTPAFLANNMFVLICAALVIFMNAGFAMVEAGLCRQKNAVNILAKNLIVFALAATAYWFIGYKIMYNASWVIPGWLKFGGVFFDPTVTPEMVTAGKLVPSVDFLFQLAFAGTAATIVSGLVAERIKFGEFIIFSLLLTGLLYSISGSWQWNEGEGWLNKLGFIDFAGSSVVHSFGAWAGLVGAIILGPRIGKFIDGQPQAIPGHNQAIATLFSQFTGGKPDLSMTINGILAGLVGVTAGCDGYAMPAAWVIGFIAGILVVYSVALIDKLGIDDPVGAWSVHGTCGIWGTLAVGVLAFALFSAITSWIAWTIIGALFGGIRVTEAEESEGLDIGEHGMEAYPDFVSAR